MRYQALAATLLFLASPVAAQGIPAQQNHLVDSVEISGEIAPVCTVENLTGAAAVVNLQVSTEQSAAQLRYACNSPNGFTRTITSANGGALVRGNQRIPYLVSHGGGGALPLTDQPLGSPIATKVTPFGNLVSSGEPGDLSVKVSGSIAGLLAGSYTDTITVAVSAD